MANETLDTVYVPVKPVWKSRTFWFNTLTIAAAVLALAGEMLDLLALPPTIGPWLLFGVGVINIILRYATVQPIDNSATLTTRRLELVDEDGTVKSNE